MREITEPVDVVPPLRALLAILLLSLCTLLQAQPHWNNIGTYRLNKVQPRDRVVPEGDFLMRLDRDWFVGRYATPGQAEAARKGAFKPRAKTTLPFVAEYPATGRQPGRFPTVAADSNTTCLFERAFALPAHWQGRRTVAKIVAPAAAAYLYVNGSEVGYSQDGGSPAEWDITRYLRTGENRITIKTLRWSDGSYLDISGPDNCPLRSAVLYSLPQTHISDIKVVADLDTANYTDGLLDIMVDLSREVSGGSVKWSLQRGQWSTNGHKTLETNDWYTSFTCRVPSVEAWSDSTPRLYRLTVALCDAAGNETERIVKAVGFRNIRVSGGLLRVNGNTLEIKGAMLTAISPSAPSDTLRQYLRLLKAQGFNAVRSAGWPDAELLCDLCDSLGFYLWDDANIGAPFGREHIKSNQWLNPTLDRAFNLYKRDRNHPSVVVWSLGTDCGNGYCTEEAYRFLKGKDGTRPVVCEGAATSWNTDIVATPGRTARYLAAYAANRRNRRPYVLASYDNTLSTEALSAYAEAMATHPVLQGGFATSPTLPAIHNAASAAIPEEPQPMPWQPMTGNAYNGGAQIKAIVANREPDSSNMHLFPSILADGRQGDTGSSSGWMAYTGIDSLVMVLMLGTEYAMTSIAVGTLNNPTLAALRPLGIDAQWSTDGRRWSRWQSLEAPSAGLSTHRAAFCLGLRRPAVARFVRLRIAARTALPIWHPKAGTPAKLLIDEIEVR